MALLEVDSLRVRFPTDRGVVDAVDGVSFELERGETLGLVGESGSGKSMANLAVLGLVPPPGIVTADTLSFQGRALLELSARALRSIRGQEISMIFQDPLTSLNPLLSVGRQLSEVLELHERVSGRSARKRSAAALSDVGISDPERQLKSFPHQLSGGMRQRVMIAMALLCRPMLLIADEPTTALDVTIQAQVLELIRDLQRRDDMALVLITHSMGVIASMADRVHVMYAGAIVEKASIDELFERPLHPYTRALLESVPRLDSVRSDTLKSIAGQPPDLAQLFPGCTFQPRCALAIERCAVERPPLVAPTSGRERGSASPLRSSACLRRDELADEVCSK